MVARAGSWRVVEVDGYLPPRPPPAGTSTPVGYKYFSPAGPVHTWRSSRPGPAAIKQQQGHHPKQHRANLAIWVFGPCHFSVVGPVAAGLVGHGTEPGCACTCAPRTIACWAAGATEPLPARTFAFSASNSACVSTPESSSSFKPFSFATVSDISAATISPWTTSPSILDVSRLSGQPFEVQIALIVYAVLILLAHLCSSLVSYLKYRPLARGIS